jgi:hypothetical protein
MKTAPLFKLIVLSLATLTLTHFCAAQASLAGDWKGTPLILKKSCVFETANTGRGSSSRPSAISRPARAESPVGTK